MSWGSTFPMGFVASMKWQFEGDIPQKVWTNFRTKFSKKHAPGWQVKSWPRAIHAHSTSWCHFVQPTRTQPAR